jgi:hypothetical protein
VFGAWVIIAALVFAVGGLSATPIAHLIGHWPALQPWAGVILPVLGSFFFGGGIQ